MPGQDEEFLAFAGELADAAAAVTLPQFRRRIDVIDKGGARGFDPVTQADRGAEQAMRALIASRYPAHGVVGEEFGSTNPGAEFQWVLEHSAVGNADRTDARRAAAGRLHGPAVHEGALRRQRPARMAAHARRRTGAGRAPVRVAEAREPRPRLRS